MQCQACITSLVQEKVNNLESLYLYKPCENYIIFSMYCGPSGSSRQKWQDNLYTLPFWKFSSIHCFLHLVALLSPQFCTTLFFDLPAKQPSFEPLHHLNGIKQDIQFLAGIQTNLEQNFLWFSALNFNSRALSCTQRACSRAPWVRKLGYLYIQEFLVLNHVTVCTPVRTTYHTNVK